MARILIVDDTEASRMLASAFAVEDGHVTVDVASGAEALRSVAESQFDIILLDRVMPGLDGYETCRRLRALTDVPIIFMTTFDQIDLVERAIDAGANDFVFKPLTRIELRVRFRAVLRTHALLRMEREAAEEVRRQRDALDQLSRQKDELASFIVHDLKSPLTSMSFMLQAVALDPALSPSLRPAIEATLGANELMSRMVMNVLHVTANGMRERAMSAQLAAVDLDAMLRATELAHRPRAAKRRITLSVVSEPLVVQADSDLIARVVNNLVDNALKFAPPGSTITISGSKRNDGIELRVADEGPGIRATDRDRVFDRFVQLDGSPSLRTGVGLGLTFCRQAVESHGGTIRIEDHVPCGAAFVLLLPDTPPP